MMVNYMIASLGVSSNFNSTLKAFSIISAQLPLHTCNYVNTNGQ